MINAIRNDVLLFKIYHEPPYIAIVHTYICMYMYVLQQKSDIQCHLPLASPRRWFYTDTKKSRANRPPKNAAKCLAFLFFFFFLSLFSHPNIHCIYNETAFTQHNYDMSMCSGDGCIHEDCSSSSSSCAINSAKISS